MADRIKKTAKQENKFIEEDLSEIFQFERHLDKEDERRSSTKSDSNLDLLSGFAPSFRSPDCSTIRRHSSDFSEEEINETDAGFVTISHVRPSLTRNADESASLMRKVNSGRRS